MLLFGISPERGATFILHYVIIGIWLRESCGRQDDDGDHASMKGFLHNIVCDVVVFLMLLTSSPG